MRATRGGSNTGTKIPLSNGQIIGWAALFGALYVLLHIPFAIRYDLCLQSATAQCYLMMKRILLGEFYIYQWAGDYTGMGPIDFVTAGLFAVFGPSIALACFVSLLFWGVGVSFLVVCVARIFGKRAAICAGCALAIGMPFYLKYSSEPYGNGYSTTALFVGFFLWLAVEVVHRGPKSWWCAMAALLMGWHWYAHKHVMVIWLSIGVAMIAVPAGREFLKGLLRSKMAIWCALAFLVGYSPELIYKMGFVASAAERTHDSASFLGIASPELMARNWYMILRCTPTYFDADPWARSPEGVHYLNHMENWESFPLNPVDTIGILAAFLVISYTLRYAVQSYREKNLEALMLAICPFVTALTVVVAARSGGAYYNIRRYILPAGIICLVWLGVRLSKDLETRKWVAAAILILALVVSFVHQMDQLGLPDELTDYRKTIGDIEAGGYKYGMSWYPFSHLLTGLSNEKVMFGIIDRTFQSPYQKPATESETVAVVWPSVSPPPFAFAQQQFFGGVKFKDDSVRTLPETISILGHEYRRIAEPKINGELGWAPYRKVI